jgi:fumarate reductase flavoprotein subunit
MSIAEPILTSGPNAQRYPQWKAVYWILDKLKNNIKNDKGRGVGLDKLSKSGRFVGDARGFVGDLSVITTVTNKGFKKVNVSKNRENRPWSAITVVPERISKRKSLAVDAVTGATITSCAIMVAADDSVSKASSASSSSKTGTSYRYNVNTGRTTVVKSQNDKSSRKSRISFK